MNVDKRESDWDRCLGCLISGWTGLGGILTEGREHTHSAITLRRKLLCITAFPAESETVTCEVTAVFPCDGYGVSIGR